jgi:hypothetical protein
MLVWAKEKVDYIVANTNGRVMFTSAGSARGGKPIAR